MFKLIYIPADKVGLKFKDGRFDRLIEAGTRFVFNPLGRIQVRVADLRAPQLFSERLDQIVASGVLDERAVVLDLADHERALVWIDGRFANVLPAGLYAFWTTHRKVRTEVVDTRQVRFNHPEINAVLQSPGGRAALQVVIVEREEAGVLFVDGAFVETLKPGRYTFWKDAARVNVVPVDLKETTVDIAGQDIMTADKVTLRLNAQLTYRVTDARAAVTTVDDIAQTLYREAQLALRAIVGGRDLDAFLADKEAVAAEALQTVRKRAQTFGVEVLAAGVRDVILPGEMKDLMNKVTEAKKAAEAQLITRREETAALRSQANTAKLLADNPTLMRLRELEVLEQIASKANLNVVLGEQGLADRVMKLL
ncbi:slipin family protein [Stratiformator vulcanicus]|uniref:FtsH protease regulator HflK n=1 Tax=Stratiformator vulcanicus TaxID=2527980 RepID=A0A517R524_9PLAN|nr:slipin family protein [Stratiformator vulcanicus]QDT38988.1 FtsH protease regulator HflK [Stratiformator vulcanicus]